MTDRQGQIGLVVLIAVHGLFALHLPRTANWADGRNDLVLAVVCGIGVGQVALLSGWTAIGPGRFVERVPALVFFIVLFWYLLLLGNRWLGLRMSLSDSVYLGILVFGEYAFLQVPFWCVRRVLDWRIERDDRDRSRERLGESQFGMGRLLAWTAGAASMLAAGRWLLPLPDERLLTSELTNPEFYVMCFAISVFHVTFSLPAVWIAFRAGWDWPVWVFVLGMFCVFFSAVEVAILTAIEGSGPDNAHAIVMAVNGGLFACIAGTFAAIRPLGFRLSPTAWPRRRRSPSATDSDPVDPDVAPSEFPHDS